jgi:two-component system, NtrC family, response regulator AtoC
MSLFQEGKGVSSRDERSSSTMLILEDDNSVADLCRIVAQEFGLLVRTALTSEQALEILGLSRIDFIIADLSVPKLSGFKFLKRVRSLSPRTAFVMLTQYGTIKSAVEAIHLGAADYIAKPFRLDELRRVIRRMVRESELDDETRALRSCYAYTGLIGTSPQIQRVHELIQKCSQNKCHVLITGETGTGKELVAKAIHFAGSHRNDPFVPVDCSSLAPTLIESELFGYVKGAFTGADQDRKGLFQAAATGTLFLDEIGELPPDLQAKLLRVLQEKEVRVVGSTNSIKTSARILAATNRNLAREVKLGRFRQDLYFRLNVVEIHMPALREHRSDIPLLTRKFLQKFNGPHGALQLSVGAQAHLIAYEWPGNVRQLENVLEQAVALGAGPILNVEDLPLSFSLNNTAILPENEKVVPLEHLKRQAILNALREAEGNKVVAAQTLRIVKTTLYRKLRAYGV